MLAAIDTVTKPQCMGCGKEITPDNPSDVFCDQTCQADAIRSQSDGTVWDSYGEDRSGIADAMRSTPGQQESVPARQHWINRVVAVYGIPPDMIETDINRLYEDHWFPMLPESQNGARQVNQLAAPFDSSTTPTSYGIFPGDPAVIDHQVEWEREEPMEWWFGHAGSVSLTPSNRAWVSCTCGFRVGSRDNPQPDSVVDPAMREHNRSARRFQ
jgi:hypothetical protein